MLDVCGRLACSFRLCQLCAGFLYDGGIVGYNTDDIILTLRYTLKFVYYNKRLFNVHLTFT